MASPTLQTRISKKKKLSLLNQSSTIHQKATSQRKAVGRVDTEIGKIVQATKKVVEATIKAAIRVKGGNEVAKSTKEANRTAIANNVSINPIAHTHKMEKAKSDHTTTGTETQDKVAVEGETGHVKTEVNAPDPKTFTTRAKRMNKVRLTTNRTTVSFTATTTTFSLK